MIKNKYTQVFAYKELCMQENVQSSLKSHPLWVTLYSVVKRKKEDDNYSNSFGNHGIKKFSN